MTFKQKIHTRCHELVGEKILSLQNSLLELEEGSEDDTKSSAGDKHETARAMMHIEQEKITHQINEVLEQKSILEKIGIPAGVTQIKTGSLVKTNNGYLFVSVALGKIDVEKISVIILSPQSPLGIKLLGLGVNEKTEINGTHYMIESIE